MTGRLTLSQINCVREIFLRCLERGDLGGALTCARTIADQRALSSSMSQYWQGRCEALARLLPDS